VPRGTDRYDEALRQGRLWTPQVIQPDLGCWYDAGDPSTITYATGVSSWRDKSNRARHATQATGASQPTYTPVGPPRVSFSGNQFLATTADTDASPSLYDYFLVGKPSPGGYCTVLYSNTAGGNLILLDTGTNNLGTYTTTTFVSSGRTWPNQMGLLYFRVTFVGGSTVYCGFARDGEASLNYVNTTGVAGSGTPSLGNVNTGGQAWGDVHEAISIISSDATSNSDAQLLHRSKLEGYAAWKWAALGAGDMVGLLPASHPFKNRPPLIGD
jgi:hypothetical protein